MVASMLRALRNAATAATILPLALAVACGGTTAKEDPSDGGADAMGGADVAILPPHDASHDHATDAGLKDVAQEPEAGPFSEAPHSLPVVTYNGGNVLASPFLVTITYSNDPNRTTEEDLGAFMVKSSWLATTGKEYGVGPGTSAKVELTQAAPASIDDTAIQSFIASLITAGTAPDPVADGGTGVNPAVYLIYFPSTTSVTLQGSDLCQVSGGGYHYESSVNAHGHSFAYAVVSPCPGLPAPPPENIVWAASHELIEACTDPYPLSAPGFAILDQSQPWAYIGGEVGDLCTYLSPQWAEGPYTSLQRVYSNASAKAGGPPCMPSPGAYFGADVEPQTFVAVAAGKSTTFQVKGWSTSAVGPWSLSATSYAVQGAQIQVGTTFASNTLDNGQTTTLTVDMPAGTPTQTYIDVLVTSQGVGSDYSTSIVGVYTP